LHKHQLITFGLLLAITSIFVAQICLFNPSTAKNGIGVVYGLGTPLQGIYVSADSATVGGNGSSFALTNALGHYNMTTGLVSGLYNVSTFAIGYISNMVPFVNVTAGHTTSGIDFDLQASGGISGTVTDAVNGHPINGTGLYALLSNGTGAYGWFGTTGTDGKYLIATNLVTGTYNVTIFFPPDGYFRKMTTANVTAGIETKNVNLQLDRSGIITGSVKAPNGTGLFDITVTAYTSDFSYYGTAKTDVSGNYRIATGLGTGNYTLSASGDGNYTVYGGIFTPISVPVTAGQETSGINIELTPITTPPTPSGTITGRVTDQSSNPVGSVRVTALGSNGTGYNETDDNGYYTISSGLKTGNDYNVTTSATGYYDAAYPTLVTVTVGQTTSNINIQITAKPPENFGTITGTVTGDPNPIIPEFQYPAIAMLTLVLATTAVGVLSLKTRRYKNKNSSHEFART
jgi:hypothetical protein